jgi:hypothetical protein
VVFVEVLEEDAWVVVREGELEEAVLRAVPACERSDYVPPCVLLQRALLLSLMET